MRKFCLYRNIDLMNLNKHDYIRLFVVHTSVIGSMYFMEVSKSETVSYWFPIARRLHHFYETYTMFTKITWKWHIYYFTSISNRHYEIILHGIVQGVSFWMVFILKFKSLKYFLNGHCSTADICASQHKNATKRYYCKSTKKYDTVR